MSAEILRRAAALMRERAKVGDGKPWTAKGASVVEPIDEMSETLISRAGFDGFAPDAYADIAQHAASWHPLVAITVADLLDAAVVDAAWYDRCDVKYDETTTAALSVARAYLGEGL